MPRKAKDEEINIKEKTTKKATLAQEIKEGTTNKKSTTRKTSSKTNSKNSSVNRVSKEITSTKDVAKSSSKVSPKKTIKTKKEDIKDSVTSKKKPKNVEVKKENKKPKESTSKTKESTSKTVVEKKSTTEKSSVSKTTKKSAASRKKTVSSKTNRTTTSKSKKLLASTEYYDLPSSYHQTVVKILAQTPSCLFVYWEIAEKDKIQLQENYGTDFFKDSKPYLIVINETMNYSFEIEINDYANSWYIHINDSDCKYTLKLIRKLINHTTNIVTSFVDIISSNEMSAPNDHILFDKLGKTVFFRNVKTDSVTSKDISSISFISNIGKIYNVYDLYKEIYKNELNGDELGTGLSSSSFSSTFK